MIPETCISIQIINKFLQAVLRGIIIIVEILADEDEEVRRRIIYDINYNKFDDGIEQNKKK